MGKKTQNGLGKTRLCEIWRGMKKRCNNPKCKDYKHYGARGIKIYKEWEKDFLTFYNWAMLNGYNENLSIDRVDNNGNYEPSNCKWSTIKEQANNRRGRVYITVDSETKTQTQWQQQLNLNKKTIPRWRQKGMTYTVEKLKNAKIKGEKNGSNKK